MDGVVDFLLEGGPSLAFLKQQYELKLNLPIFAFNSVPFDTELQQNLSWGNGMVYFDQILPGSPEFKDRFKARFGRSVGMSSAQAYDAVYIIKAAIERCLSAGKSDRGADLRDCVAATNYQGQSGKIDFGPSGAITSHADTTYLMQIKDGKIEPAAAKAE